MNLYKKYLVRQFVKNIDSDFRVSFSKTFEVDIEEEHIYATFYKNPKLDKLYIEFLKEYFGNDSYNMFLMSLLHEIGHIMTYDPEDEEDRLMKYGLLKIFNQEKTMDEETANHHYFLIPMEYKATEWGVWYYNTHREVCDKLIQKLGESYYE